METKEYNDNLNELLFLLEFRDRPTLVLIECSSYFTIRKITDIIKNKIPKFKFFNFEITASKINSLVNTLQKELPEEIINSKPIEYIVNIIGLENNLTILDDNTIKPSKLIDNLNFERENLFQNFNFITIIWINSFFLKSLQTGAPDLWSWITYKFTLNEDIELIPNFLEENREFDVSKYIQSLKDNTGKDKISSLLSLYESININSSDKKKLIIDKTVILNNLSAAYLNIKEYSNSIKFAKDAIRLGNIINDKKVLAQLYQTIAYAFYEQKKLVLAVENYNLAIKYAKSENLNHIILVCYFQKSVILHTQGYFKQAISLLNKIISQSANFDTNFIFAAYYQLALVYYDTRNFSKSIEFLEKAIPNFAKGSEILVEANLLIAKSFRDLKRYNEAINSINEAISNSINYTNSYRVSDLYAVAGLIYEHLNNYDEAIKYNSLSITESRIKEDFAQLSKSYHNLGNIYVKKNEYKRAIDYYHEAKEIADRFGSDIAKGIELHSIGWTHIFLEKYDEAIEIENETIKLLKTSNNPDILARSYWVIAYAYERKNEYAKSKKNYETAFNYSKKSSDPELITKIKFDLQNINKKNQ